MGKIATEQEAYNIGGKGTPNNNKCATKSRAEALGCKVNGNYKDNQLVQVDDLSMPDAIIITLSSNWNGNSDVVENTGNIKDNYYSLEDFKISIKLMSDNGSKAYGTIKILRNNEIVLEDYVEVEGDDEEYIDLDTGGCSTSNKSITWELKENDDITVSY